MPINHETVCSNLPRPSSDSGIIMVKLKRKLQYKGHQYFQAVRPSYIAAALQWLQMNNPLYQQVTISADNFEGSSEMVNRHFTGNETEIANNSMSNCLSGNRNSALTDDDLQNSEDTDEIEDPLNEFRNICGETCLQAYLPDYSTIMESSSSPLFDNPVANSRMDTERVLSGDEVVNIAPSECKHPVSLMHDEFCEELSFPTLFPKGRFGYKVERRVKLTPTKYFNARLLHYSGRYAVNPEYIFFAQFLIEQKKVSDSINIALKKTHGESLIASNVKRNSKKLKHLMFTDQAYLFMQNIPGSLPYWQKFKKKAIAMVHQLGCPTWFMTLSCADLRWTELFKIIARTWGINMSVEDIEQMTHDDRCKMLNLNPVLVTFPIQVGTFFQRSIIK